MYSTTGTTPIEPQTIATGILSIKYEYFISRGRTFNGSSCENDGSECDPRFEICLRFGHTNAIFTCSSARIVAPQLLIEPYSNTDSVEFGTKLNGTPNPVEYLTDSLFDVS